eukprot:6994129-Pyramimonas_sp.AAC.1
MPQAKRARPPRGASRSPALPGCVKRSAQEYLARGISEPRIARASRAKRVGQPGARHLGAQSCEGASGQT